MEQIGVRELKSKLSAFLERVDNGEEFEVTDHGRPVARLAPLSFYPASDAAASGFSLGEPTAAYSPESTTQGGRETKHPRKKRTPEQEQESYASLLRYAQKKGKHKTQKEALTAILREHVLRQRRLEIFDLAGKIDYYPDYDYKAERRRQ